MPPLLAPLGLTADHLDQLRGGAGDRATVEVLRAGQLGKHFLLLHQVVLAAAQRDAATAARVRTWFTAIAAAERACPAGVRDVLGYPTVGMWAAGCLAALRAGRPASEAALAHFGELAAACALAADLSPVDSDEDGGYVALPTLGAGTPGAMWEGVRRVRVDVDGLLLDVRLDDVDPFRDRHGLGASGRLTAREAELWERALTEAWRLLVATAPRYAEGMAAGLRCVVPLRPGDDAHGVSATSEHGFGGVSISAVEPDALAVGLLHEFQHSKLNALAYLLDLWTDGPRRHYSPWRDDPRPVGGVLHGAYAYLAVTDFRRLQDGPLAAFEYARWREAVDRTLRALMTSGQLTSDGERFVAGMATRLGPAPTDRWAHAAVTEHRLAWRLRNVAPDDAAVDRLVEDWTSRRGPSPAVVPVTVRAAPWQATGVRGRRLDLIHRRLTGGSWADGDPGDVAYLEGRLGDALGEYKGKSELVGWLLIEAHPAPEVLAALLRRLPDADPEALHRWSLVVRTDLPDW